MTSRQADKEISHIGLSLQRQLSRKNEISSSTCQLAYSSAVLDRLHEEDDVVAVSLLQVTELLDGVASITLGVAVPHDSLHGVACAAVVETVFGTGAELRQSAAPERSGAAPACADVVLHEETVLYEVGVRPYLLVRIAWHVVVFEDAVRVLDVVVAGGP